jgi:EAL domain-containing protein (putative c-di-GMP-specific phosphodiesterase class I)
MIAPGDFISIAEETGLILPIGSWVLREATAQAQRWRAQGLTVPRIAVNVSARQLWHGGLDVELQRALDQSGMDPQLLELELTESVFLRSSEDVTATLARLDSLGVRIAIDDFGTGYSSLGYLRRLPVDTLKLDRSFVQDLPHSMEAAAIASAVISLASGLGISVVAEGVETEAQCAYLRGQRCHQLQGFYFSKPLPAEACAAVLRAGVLRGDGGV